MSQKSEVRSRCCRWLTVFALGVLLSGAARGAEKQGNSLDLVPADASFYSASLRWREQLELARHSKAWQRVQQMPLVQMGWQTVLEQLNRPESQFDVVQSMFELPENQQLLELLGDMFSHEAFIYGDPSVVQVSSLLSSAWGASQFQNFKAAIDNAVPGAERPTPAQTNRANGRAFLEQLAANLDAVRIPNMVLGFKITKTEPAVTQLKRLEVLLRLALKKATPPLSDRLQRVAIGEASFLSLALDGELIPWQELEWEKLEDKPGEFAPLVEKLKATPLVISLGVRDDYLLVSLGASNEHLERLGKGELLLERPELKPLLGFLKERLTGVSYSSQALNRATRATAQDFDTLPDLADTAAERLGLEADVRQRLRGDAAALAADVKRSVPEPGAVLAFSFLTARGIEGYRHDWSQNLLFDGSKPLSLLEHLGGTPLVAAVVRGKHDPELWDRLVRWTKTGLGYVEEFGVPQLAAGDRAKYDKMMGIVRPLALQLSETTGKCLLPALADGQSALVLDAKLTSPQWQRMMPRAAQPLPMFQPALVMGVSDPALLQQALGEYRTLIEAAVNKLRSENAGQGAEDFKLPVPAEITDPAGTIYTYALPAEIGLDARLQPNSGFGPRVAVFSLAPLQTKELLTPQPFKLPEALGDAARPLAGASWVDLAGILEALQPWIEFGFQQANAKDNPTDDAGQGVLDPSSQFFLDQTREVLAVLKVFRSFASVSYLSDGAMVRHGELHLQDLE